MESQHAWVFVATVPLPPPAYTPRTVQIKADEPLLPPSHYYLRWFRPLPPAPQTVTLELSFFTRNPLLHYGPPKSIAPWPARLAPLRLIIEPGRGPGPWELRAPDPPPESEIPLQFRFFCRNATWLEGPPAREVMWPWRLANPVHLLRGWPFQ